MLLLVPFDLIASEVCRRRLSVRCSPRPLLVPRSPRRWRGDWRLWIPPRRLALVGAVAMASGQLLIAMGGARLDIVVVLACAMGLQGCGVGLFQVAYFDIVTASIPRSDRGVAGSRRR